MRCGGGLANWEGTCEECIATLEEYPCADGSNFADGVCDCRCEVGFDDCEDLSKRPEPALVMCGQTTLAFDFYNQEATCDLCSIDTAPLPPTVTELPQGCEQPGLYYDQNCDCQCDGDYACLDPFYKNPAVVKKACCGSDNCFNVPRNDGSYPTCDQCPTKKREVMTGEINSRSMDSLQGELNGDKEKTYQLYDDEHNT